jgi:Methylase involved in ubiquinone/menaquinone biosynthesis
MPDLHAGFAEPQKTSAAILAEFLDEVDRMPAVQEIKAKMLRAADLRPGMRVLDAGCGHGIELIRQATDHPDVFFTGLDRNPDLLAMARERGAGLNNVEWVQADLDDPGLPEDHFDVIRTERVLMYAAGPAFGRQLDILIRLLRPGGRLVLSELDYGSTMLPIGDQGEAVTRAVQEIMEKAMPEPWAGRRIPVELAARGMIDVVAEPYWMVVSEPVWLRIVAGTVRDALDRDPVPRPEIQAWLDDHAKAAAEHPLRAAFAGVLTTARRPA